MEVPWLSDWRFGCVAFRMRAFGWAAVSIFSQMRRVAARI
jgi:hypothetical protein